MYKELNEQELARYCSEHDRMAEEELHRRYAVRVFAICRRYTANMEDAKDLSMEVLMLALQKIESYQYSGKGSLYGWLRRITINLAVNHIKRPRIMMLPLDPWAKDVIEDPSAEEVETVPKEQMLSWISELPPMKRAVFNLFHIDGYSHRQISELLDISEKSSSSILAKAKKDLKAKIRQYNKDRDK